MASQDREGTDPDLAIEIDFPRRETPEKAIARLRSGLTGCVLDPAERTIWLILGEVETAIIAESASEYEAAIEL